ncbi:hypothetical protein OG218_00480 [Kineococcus sp. NBC_00420]|uniref:hypothetical protein n=1 Tax=Kineococcus sp. NBC_00420 TaxID=2903564 RepID=UPI002E1E56A9
MERTVIPLIVRDHEGVEQTSRAVIAFDAEDSLEPIVFVDLSFAASSMEAIDVDDGEYEEIAWFDDGEVIKVGIERVARADLRVKLTPTGQYDLPALREALARTRPDLAEADVVAVRAFAAEELAAEETWQESRWHRRLSRWLHRQQPS